MLASMQKNWWVPFVRGIFAILFGLFALFAPGATLTALILVFGIYAVLDGAATVYSAFDSRETHNRWWIGVVEGVIGIIAGVVAFVMPVLAGLTLLIVIGLWAIMTGVMQIVAAIQLRKEIENEVLLGIAGIMSVIFGAYLVLFPLGGALAVAWLIGIYSIVFGGMLIALGWKLRSGETPESGQSSRQTAAHHPS